MRVCHIISGDLWAGAEVMSYRLLNGLKNNYDIELHAILLNEGKLAEELRKNGIAITVVDESKNNIFQILYKVRSLVKKFSPNVIHSHRFKENILAYLSVIFNVNVPIVCTQHGMPEPLMNKKKALEKYILSKYHYSIISKKFKYVIAVSEDVKRNLIKDYGFQEYQVIVIHNGTPVPDKQSHTTNSNKFVIGSAGRFYPVKDYCLMVNVAKEVLKQTDKIVFRLAGEGPEKERIVSLVNKYNVGNAFLLTGFIDDMADFYRNMDLYINTSIHEGIPMGILEAMSYGVPVIGPRCGGLSEILSDGVQGFLVEGRDPEIFAEKCLRLFSNPELHMKMRAASRERVIEEFSVERMTQNYYDVYKNILKCNM